MSSIKKISKSIKNNIDKEISTVTDIATGKYKSKYTLKQFIDIRWMFGNGAVWLLFLVIILAFCVGFWYASQRYQEACNEFIVDNFYNNTESDYYNMGIEYGLPGRINNSGFVLDSS